MGTLATWRRGQKTARPLLKTRTRRVVAALASPGRDRECATEHIRASIQLLEALLEFGTLDGEDRKGAWGALRQLWRALREMHRGRT